MGALFSKKNGVWLRVSGGKKEPYNDALALVGIDKVDSLSMILTNSEYCTALAGNAAAYTIMKDNYSSDMTTAIDSGWNDGLNLLNYKCKLKCYLYKAGNTCEAVSGGWTYTNENSGSGAITHNVDNMAFGASSGSSWSADVVGQNLCNKGASLHTVNKISGFSKVEMKFKCAQAYVSARNVGGLFMYGLSTVTSSRTYLTGYKWHSISTPEYAYTIVDQSETAVAFAITESAYPRFYLCPPCQAGGSGSNAVTLNVYEVALIP